MKCVTCGAELADYVKFCTVCGTPVKKEAPAAPVAAPAPAPVAAPAPAPVVAVPAPAAAEPNNRGLMGPWAYFGLQLLFAVPVVGFIFLIIFSFNKGNLNRRNFARSYWCGLLVFLILLIIVLVLALVMGVGVSELLSDF